MAFQSIWYYTDLPAKVVDIIEEDLTENFDYGGTMRLGAQKCKLVKSTKKLFLILN